MGPFAFEQLTAPEAGVAINWATLLALGLGDIVAIDFMARVFSAESPETAQRACFIGCAGTLISPIVGLIAFVVVSNLTYTPQRVGDRPESVMVPGQIR